MRSRVPSRECEGVSVCVCVCVCVGVWVGAWVCVTIGVGCHFRAGQVHIEYSTLDRWGAALSRQCVVLG